MYAMPSTSPRFLDRVAATLSPDNQRLFLAVLALAVVPLWLGPYLPMVDMPQHAAQITALREIWSGNAELDRVFWVNWFTPYLLGYLLLYAFSAVLPITVAAKLLVTLSVVAVPLLTGPLLRAAGGDERWRWLAIPCSFGFAFYWGFLSFLVAAPLALLFLTRTITFAHDPSWRRGVRIAVFAIFLFFSHVIVLGIASLISLGYVLGVHYRDLRRLALCALPYTAPIPLIGLWFAITYATETRVQNDAVSFGPLSYRLLQLVSQPAGREALSTSSAGIVLLVTGAIVLLPWLCGARPSRRPERWLPFALALLVFLGAPHYVFDAAYFYQRLGLFLVPLWLLLWDRPGVAERRFEWIAIPIAMLWVVASIGRFAAFARESESFSAVVGALEPGRRVAAMVFEPGSALFPSPVYLHFPAWYQATEAGIVDFNFAEFYSQMVRYRPNAGPRITEAVSWSPVQFDWEANGGASYDYFLIKARFDLSAAVFKDKVDNVELVTQQGWWWLYRNRARVQP
jgi:hypothetical protein